ncbi:hypothetical protein [Candidatus Frankia alpina]|uniref:hypothetical protein n=1 Tax=Candidatus Frankia alpina TaxID=2699483 RepID=UPI001F2EE3C0|nr:hypothetical protein [Candidatus Frankia alpina]
MPASPAVGQLVGEAGAEALADGDGSPLGEAPDVGVGRSVCGELGSMLGGTVAVAWSCGAVGWGCGPPDKGSAADGGGSGP